jgi:hypothetical protein
MAQSKRRTVDRSHVRLAHNVNGHTYTTCIIDAGGVSEYIHGSPKSAPSIGRLCASPTIPMVIHMPLVLRRAVYLNTSMDSTQRAVDRSLVRLAHNPNDDTYTPAEQNLDS